MRRSIWSSFEEQRHIQDRYGRRGRLPDGLHAAGALLPHPGVDNRFENGPLPRVAENDGSQSAAVELPVGPGDAAAEMGEDPVIERGAPPDDLARDPVGIDEAGSG